MAQAKEDMVIEIIERSTSSETKRSFRASSGGSRDDRRYFRKREFSRGNSRNRFGIKRGTISEKKDPGKSTLIGGRV